MNWVLSVLAGLAVAVLVLYFIKKNPPPVAVETYVQQPVRKGADILEQDSMLVAVGLQALYTPRPSVMDTSEISRDAWLASQAAATGGAPTSTSMQDVEQQQAQMGLVTPGMAGSPMWSTGAPSSQMMGGGQPGQMQVFLPDGPTASEQLRVPGPTSSVAAAPRARSQADEDASRERAINEAAKNAALRQESADVDAWYDRNSTLKSDAERDYTERWLPARPSGSQTDTASNRASYVGSLQAKLNQDTLNFNNYFDSDYTTMYGATSIGTPAYWDQKNTAQNILYDADDTISILDSEWQSSSAVNCYPLAWPQFESETVCSKSCGPGRKVQTRRYVEPQNGGRECPPPASRQTREIDCQVRACVLTDEAATPVCVTGATWRVSDKKCVNTSQENPAGGCGAGYTYNATSGYCDKNGYTSIRPSPPNGFIFNATTKNFEQTSDPTWTCATAGFQVSRGFLGLSDPFCRAYI